MSKLTQDGKLIAVARANNSIEIWIKETWSQLLVLPGHINAPVRRIHWIEKYQP
jgi:hypothetical protein